MEAWPFIAARNATLDWRPILAPPFLIEAGADYLLVHETGRYGAHPLPVTHTFIDTKRAGAMTLVFRSVAAQRGLLDAVAEGDPDQLRDRYGRPIYVVEGLAVRGHCDSDALLSDTALAAVHDLTTAVFGDFWTETAEASPPVPSSPLTIPDVAESSTTAESKSDDPVTRVIASIASVVATAVARVVRIFCKRAP